jgi:hypothetical protein
LLLHWSWYFKAFQQVNAWRPFRESARIWHATTVKQLVEIDVPLSLARRQRAAVLFADM